MLKTDTRSSKDTTEVRVNINNSNLTLNNQVYDGNDLIKIFDFLTRFVIKADMINMSEAQAIIVLQTFLIDPTGTQFSTKLIGASRHGRITWWQEAMQCLLRTYEAASAMCEVLEDLH